MISPIELPPFDIDKIAPGKILVLGEPILERRPPTIAKRLVMVPVGYMGIGRDIACLPFSDEEEHQAIAREYFDIALTLRLHGIPFQYLKAHPDRVDPEAVAVLQSLGSEELRHSAMTPDTVTCFPRDMLVDFDRVVFINPEAQLSTRAYNYTRSLLGSGGAVLKRNNKALLASPLGIAGARRKYEQDIKHIPSDHKIGFLPWPLVVVFNERGAMSEPMPNPHPDRVSALLRGQKGGYYYLVNQHYYDTNQLPWGKYSECFKETCCAMNIELIVVQDRLIYGLNLEQFNDGTVMMSAGDRNLERVVGEVVGRKNVFTTTNPIIHHPLRRSAGIRCLTLVAPIDAF